ncbi:unnamed protein product, partial [Caenorhabditis brenneri]
MVSGSPKFFFRPKYALSSEKIEDLTLRSCYDGDRDAEVISDINARGKVKETVNEDRLVVIEHAAEVLQFLTACTPLDHLTGITISYSTGPAPYFGNRNPSGEYIRKTGSDK